MGVTCRETLTTPIRSRCGVGGHPAQPGGDPGRLDADLALVGLGAVVDPHVDDLGARGEADRQRLGTGTQPAGDEPGDGGAVVLPQLRAGAERHPLHDRHPAPAATPESTTATRTPAPGTRPSRAKGAQASSMSSRSKGRLGDGRVDRLVVDLDRGAVGVDERRRGHPSAGADPRTTTAARTVDWSSHGPQAHEGPPSRSGGQSAASWLRGTPVRNSCTQVSGTTGASTSAYPSCAAASGPTSG